MTPSAACWRLRIHDCASAACSESKIISVLEGMLEDDCGAYDIDDLLQSVLETGFDTPASF